MRGRRGRGIGGYLTFYKTERRYKAGDTEHQGEIHQSTQKGGYHLKNPGFRLDSGFVGIGDVRR